MKKVALHIRLALCTVLCAVAWQATAQDIRLNGHFHADSVRVGDELFFTLTAKYPAENQIVFPDSAFDYSPFEFREKRYFTTVTSNGISYDSAVYHLSTFEVDSIQQLRLPVFRVNALDCTRYMTTWDTIRLQASVKNLPDKLTSDLPLRATIGYQNVALQFNYPLIIVIAGVLLCLAVVIWVVFGKRIRDYIKARKMQKAHEEFVREYATQIDRLRTAFSPDVTERAVTLWKKYMEDMNRLPYTKLTTPETLRIEKDEQLGKNLRMIDAAIYGTNTDVISPLENLKGYADQRFNHKIREVRNG